MPFDPNKTEDWQATANKHIWFSPSLNKFVFSNEGEQYDTTPYDTFEDAEKGLKDYCKMLNGESPYPNE